MDTDRKTQRQRQCDTARDTERERERERESAKSKNLSKPKIVQAAACLSSFTPEFNLVIDQGK